MIRYERFYNNNTGTGVSIQMSNGGIYVFVLIVWLLQKSLLATRYLDNLHPIWLPTQPDGTIIVITSFPLSILG